MASIKQKDERKFKITVSNGYHTDGRKVCRAQTLTVPDTIPKRQIEQYVMHAAEDMEREFKYGYSEDSNTTFEAFAEKWLGRQTKYAPSTLGTYRSNLRIVYPVIGCIPLCRIRPITLENMCLELRKRIYHSQTVREQTIQKYLTTVSAVLSDAKKNEIIPHNPARMIDLPKVEPTRQEIPSPKEVERFIQLLLEKESIVFAAYYLLDIYTGCRRGELCALRWNDLNHDTLVVSKSRTNVPGVGVVEGKTKNGKARIIRMNGSMHDILFRLLLEQSYENQDTWNSNWHIFTRLDGKIPHPDTFSKHLRKFFDCNGFSRKYHLHTFRHFCASYLMNNSISNQVTASILGHRDTGFLERTYYHPDTEYQEEASECISDFIFRNEKLKKRLESMHKLQ